MILAVATLLLFWSTTLDPHRFFCEGWAVNHSTPQQPAAPTSQHDRDDNDDLSHSFLTTRRHAFVTATIASCWASCCTILLVHNPDKALAFDNKISNKYDDRPKRRGPAPNDLGLRARTIAIDEFDESNYVGLKGCGPAPNCFSSSIPVNDDPDHSIPAWISTSGNVETAFAQLKQAVETYPPGQNGVDGGGFQIQTYDPVKGYLYVQFEALKNGYIDDVEFAIVEPPPADGSSHVVVQVRSSSRVGYLDYGVNAKRLNYLADAMRTKGWNSPGVDLKTHPFYASENQQQS